MKFQSDFTAFLKIILCTHINYVINRQEQDRMVRGSELIEKVRRGGFIFISESALVEYTIQDDCSLEQIGEVFNAINYGLVLKPGAHFFIYSIKEKKKY